MIIMCPTHSEILRRFEPLDSVARLALIGVAKNCGKTTTLNFLLASGVCAGRTVGLVSVGIDGEVADLLLGTGKPPILAREGDWVVTARDALLKSSARVEYVASMGFSTPLGEVVCARVIEAGTVVLAGLRHREDLRQAIALLESHGVDLVFVDGAYGRTIGASSGIADGVIVSTGAVLSDKIAVICARTEALIQRLGLEPITLDWQQKLMEQAIAEDRFLLGGAHCAPIASPATSALLGLSEAAERWSDALSAVAIPGLVSDRVVEYLLSLPVADESAAHTLLVPDGTVLQASSRLLRRLRRRWRIRALSAAPILAISVNPSSIAGHEVDAGALCEALQARWPQTLIFNPKSAP